MQIIQDTAGGMQTYGAKAEAMFLKSSSVMKGMTEVKSDKWSTINQTQIAALKSESYAVITISSYFQTADKAPISPDNFCLSQNSIGLLNESIRVLKYGGLMFVYGLPHDLCYFGEYLSNSSEMLFKYWITLGIDDRPAINGLKPESMGLLMYLKSKPRKSPTPFNLNTDSVRFKHTYCAACGENTKDWGGKKHLMHPSGTSISDVWRDLPRQRVTNHTVPAIVLDRIYALTKQEGAQHLHVVQKMSGIEAAPSPAMPVAFPDADDHWCDLNKLKLDEIYQGDSIAFLRRVSEIRPEGAFDLCFADPPYNLEKGYNSYHDALADHRYLSWCNHWLEGMVQALKPGGALFILNLPKWSIHHAAYLNRRLEFRHWITWDALSDPRGKMMPAHYSLLYYVKRGAEPVFNHLTQPDSPCYCLRASCVKRRKKAGNDAKVELSDIWFDVHRIKHKKDRDAHPCQLPEKLMERIISLTTRPGDVVFDPFGGAGTTAIAAKKLGRRFVMTEIDSHYAKITRDKLATMDAHADLFGVLRVPRQSVKRHQRLPAAKKHIELYLQKLALDLGREPAESEIDSHILHQIDLIYPDRLTAIKRCRVVLRSQQPALQTSA